MSIVATNWAMEQLTDGPSAQSVLFIIADRANEHGVCRHADPDTIAKKTRQSRATVFRRLEELERVELITRLTRHTDDGRREYEIRLRFGYFVNYKVAKDRAIIVFAHNDEDQATELKRIPYNGNSGDDDSESQSETQGESQIETQSVSPVRPTESQSCDSHMSPSKNPDIPPKPPLAEMQQGGREEGSEDDRAFEARLSELKRSYPIPTNHPERVRSTARALTETEWPQVITGARGVRAFREANAKRPPAIVDLAKFIATPALWSEYAPYAPTERRAAERVTVLPGSEAWRGFVVVKRVWKLAEPEGAIEVDSAAVPALKSLSALYDLREDDWVAVFEKRDHKQAAAWRERLNACGFKMPDAERIFTGETHPTLGEVWHAGWCLPCEWPPRMDGSLCTGPPTSPTLTAEDLDELEKLK